MSNKLILALLGCLSTAVYAESESEMLSPQSEQQGTNEAKMSVDQAAMNKHNKREEADIKKHIDQLQQRLQDTKNKNLERIKRIQGGQQSDQDKEQKLKIEDKRTKQEEQDTKDKIAKLQLRLQELENVS